MHVIIIIYLHYTYDYTYYVICSTIEGRDVREAIYVLPQYKLYVTAIHTNTNLYQTIIQ